MFWRTHAHKAAHHDACAIGNHRDGFLCGDSFHGGLQSKRLHGRDGRYSLLSVADHSAALICIKGMKRWKLKATVFRSARTSPTTRSSSMPLTCWLDALFGASADVRRSSATASRKMVSRHRS